MPNEDGITGVDSLCYLILLMDSLGLEVNSVKVSEFWTQSLQQKELSAELIELLVFFWQRAGKQREFSPLTFTAVTHVETKELIEVTHKAFESSRIAEIKITEPEQAQEVIEKLTAKEEPIPKTIVNSTENPLESTPVQMTAVMPPTDTNMSGRYIYGIVFGGDDFQSTGIDGNPVYTVSYRDIGALVHSCPPNAYESTDREQVENWLRQHQKVVDEALKYTNSLVPMSFDVIIDGSSADNPENVLKQWLQERYTPLKDLLEQLSGRVEYGIKIYYSIEKLTEKVTKENPEIIELTNRLASMSKGTAYLFRSELSQKIRKAVEEEGKILATEIIVKIGQMVIDVKENKVEAEISNSQKPILNLAVLADPDKVDVIGDFLESLQTNGGYVITFTGPWPVYSFVKDLN
jgi:hypothetical protein